MKSNPCFRLKSWAVAAGTFFTLAGPGAWAQAEKPQYGGTLEMGTTSVAVSTLSWDLADWQATLQTRDTGQFYEQLFSVDLSKAKSRGGPYSFTLSGWQPADAVRGELAESWQWVSPLVLEIKIRKGIKFPAKQGVMAERELTAEDIVFNFNRMNSSPKRTQGYFDHVNKVEATDKYTVVFNFNQFIADWDYRFGNGFFSGIVPKEVVDAGAGNWKSANGTGPFMLSNVVQGSALTFTKNPIYWDKEKIGGTEYKIPFVDKLVHRVIKDESTQYAALRTGKLDILASIPSDSAAELKKSAPQLKWNRWLSTGAYRIAFRVDAKPFNDVRVRRALNLAVNKQEIIDKYYTGEAAMFTFPMHPEYVGYHKSLKEMPESVQELFKYSPDKAKKLLAEAGYPNGFSFKLQLCTCAPDQMELMPLVAAYLEGVGVKMELVPMEYAAYLSTMTSHTNGAAYLTNIPDVNPATSLRINFGKGQVYNAPMWDDAKFDAAVKTALHERDDKKRQQILKDQTTYILEQAPALWMPAPYRYTAWWPWVKNYGGELFVGAGRSAPIYARVWIDEGMKKKMGF